MNKLTASHFAFQCPMNWDDMSPTHRGRFCGKCRKEVFDLTNCSITEVIALQRKHGPICGSIKVAAAAISLSAAACQNQAPNQTTGTPQVPHGADSNQEVMMSGVICPPDEMEQMKRSEGP